MGAIEEYRVDIRTESLQWLKPAIEGWHHCINRYLRLMNKDSEKNLFWDVPYFYNERANIGLLAVGAYQGDMVSLEEYVTTKKLRGEDEKNGRTDLYIACHDNDIAIEAKSTVVGPGTRLPTIEKTLESAVADARRNRYVSQKAGCAFYVPQLPRRRSFDLASEDLSGLLETFDPICESADLVAWCFPRQTRNFVSYGFCYPGVLIAMKLS